MKTEEKVSAARAALEQAILSETEAASRVDSADPSDVIALTSELTVAQAKTRQARRDLEAAEKEHVEWQEAARQAEIERCRPLASHERFASELAPLVKRVVKACREIASAINDANAVRSAQNEAASVCGATKLTIGQVLAQFVAAVSRDPSAHVDSKFITAYPLDRLATVAMTLVGESPFDRPDGLSDEEIVNMILRGESPNQLKREQFEENRKQVASEVEAREAARKEVERRRREEHKRITGHESYLPKNSN